MAGRAIPLPALYRVQRRIQRSVEGRVRKSGTHVQAGALHLYVLHGRAVHGIARRAPEGRGHEVGFDNGAHPRRGDGGEIRVEILPVVSAPTVEAHFVVGTVVAGESVEI